MNKDKIAAQTVKDFYEKSPSKLYKKGSVILQPSEDTLPPITYIETGIVGQYDITTEGNKVIVNIFKPGAFFPVSSAINRSFNSYYFEAMTDISVKHRTSELIAAFLQDKPLVVYDLLQRLYRGIDGMLRRMVLLLGETADMRVLYELFIFADRFGKKLPDGSIVLQLTANELSQQTGLARETVSRELKKLKESGLITVRRGYITLTKQ